MWREGHPGPSSSACDDRPLSFPLQPPPLSLACSVHRSPLFLQVASPADLWVSLTELRDVHESVRWPRLPALPKPRQPQAHGGDEPTGPGPTHLGTSLLGLAGQGWSREVRDHAPPCHPPRGCPTTEGRKPGPRWRCLGCTAFSALSVSVSLSHTQTATCLKQVPGRRG